MAGKVIQNFAIYDTELMDLDRCSTIQNYRCGGEDLSTTLEMTLRAAGRQKSLDDNMRLSGEKNRKDRIIDDKNEI